MVRLSPKAREMVTTVLGDERGVKFVESELSKEDVEKVRSRMNDSDVREVFETGYTEEDFLEDLDDLEQQMLDSVSELVSLANERKQYWNMAENAPTPVDEYYWRLASGKGIDVKVKLREFSEYMAKYFQKKQYLAAWRVAVINADEDKNVQMDDEFYENFKENVGPEAEFNPQQQVTDGIVAEEMNTGSMAEAVEAEKQRARDGNENEGLGISESERREMFEQNNNGMDALFEFDPESEQERARQTAESGEAN